MQAYHNAQNTIMRNHYRKNLTILLTALLYIILICPIPEVRADEKIETSQTEKLSQKEKSILLDYAYDSLDTYFDNTKPTPKIPAHTIKRFDYHKLFITFLNDRKIRCCQSGKHKKNDPDRLFKDIDQAVSRCINDERFGGTLKEHEVPKVEMVFNFLHTPQALEENTIVSTIFRTFHLAVAPV